MRLRELFDTTATYNWSTQLPNWQLVENSDDYFYYDKTSRKTQ